MRALHTVSLGLLALSLPGCFDHHTADEQVLELVEVEDGGITSPKDASISRADGGCSSPDVFQNLLCNITGGGNTTGDAGSANPIDAFIKQILGGTGTGTQNCAKETDQIAQILCTVTGGSGIEGIIGGLLGGGGDAGAGGGIEGILNDVIVEVLSGIVDDLISSILNPQPTTPRDGGAGGLLGGLFGGGAPATPRDGGAGGLLGGLFGSGGFQLPTRDGGFQWPALGSTNQALTGSGSDQLVRSEAECASAYADDLLTRLVCARQNLDKLSGR